MPGGINIYIYISTHIQNGAVLFGIENMSKLASTSQGSQICALAREM